MKTFLTLMLFLSASCFAEQGFRPLREFRVLGSNGALRAMSPDSRYLAIESGLEHQRTLEVYDWNCQQKLTGLAIDGNKVAVTFTPDSQKIVVGRSSGVLEAYDLVTAQKVVDRDLLPGTPIGSLSMTESDQGTLLFMSALSTAVVLRFSDLTTLHSFPRDADDINRNPAESDRSWLRFPSAISLNGKLAAESDISQGRLRVFDLVNGVQLPGDLLSEEIGTNERPLFIGVGAPSTYKASFIIKLEFTNSADTLIAIVSDVYSNHKWYLLDPLQQIIERDHIAWPPESHPDRISIDRRGERILHELSRDSALRRRALSQGCARVIGTRVRSNLAHLHPSAPVNQSSTTLKLSEDGKVSASLLDGVLRVWRIP